VYLQLVIKFRGSKDKDFETLQGHILPAIKNLKGKYCLFSFLIANFVLFVAKISKRAKCEVTKVTKVLEFHQFNINSRSVATP
jgi:hypothetical protein